MASRDFVPVTGDDWYQRRRRDADGTFFRLVADQGPRPADGPTRQGVYVFSAGGKLLAYVPGNAPAGYMHLALVDALAQWEQLPDAERRPGAVQVGDAGTPDQRYVRTLPPDGLVLEVHTRALERPASGASWEAMRIAGTAPARDRLWLTEAEWRSLVPLDVTRGDTFPVPATVGDRILRFHLVDNTRGEPHTWRRDHIRASRLTLTVEEASAARLRMRLDGVALLATDEDRGRADRGYDVQLLGYLDYDRARAVFARFDLLALGDRWSGDPEAGDRGSARGPLGVAFELARGGSAADYLPPHAARNASDYFRGERRP